MAVNKVVYGNNTLMDITDTTATSDTVLQGYAFYDASGQRRTGSADYMDKVDNPTAGEILITDAAGQAIGSGVKLADKQDTLTFDITPTRGSTNPVTSHGIKSYVDGRDPFMLLDFAKTINNGSITSCSDDTIPSSEQTGRIDIEVPTALQADWAIASLAKWEIKNGSTRIPAWPVYAFSMNSQKVLRCGFKTTGTAAKAFTNISGAVLLKHR